MTGPVAEGPAVVRVAAYQQAVTPRPWAEFVRHGRDAVAQAATAGAQFLVFPEYGTLEIVGEDEPTGSAPGRPHGLEGVAALAPALDGLFEELARAHGVVIAAPSRPAAAGQGFRNRVCVFGPDGPLGIQEKLVMTRFERESWRIDPGDALYVFAAFGVRFGVAICYDVEFPPLARALAVAGAELLLVPSCTDTLAGYHRVRWCAQARAIEGQCAVAQAVTIGEADWSDALDCNVGHAGVFGPADRGWPPDGVLALGDGVTPGWTMADVDVGHLRHTRRAGQVLNHRHYVEAERIGPPVEATWPASDS